MYEQLGRILGYPEIEGGRGEAVSNYLDGLARMVRRSLKETSFKLFFAFDRIGLHVLPKHFYTPIPDYRWLSANRDLWMGRSTLRGINWDLEEQFQWVAGLSRSYYGEVAGLQLFNEVTSTRVGPGFGPIESQLLHCFVRSKCPPRIIEIGSGVSTACMLHAIELNKSDGRVESQLICVEPFPKDAFRHIKNITHLKELCQKVPQSFFGQLQAGDLLFIDSSHAVKIGSEVLPIYLDIIPSLPAGVYIHIHDINLPYAYPRDALQAYFGAQETALLLALLVNNPRLCIRACLSGLHYGRAADLKEIMTDYRPQANNEGIARDSQPGHFPSSIWLQTN